MLIARGDRAVVAAILAASGRKAPKAEVIPSPPADVALTGGGRPMGQSSRRAEQRHRWHPPGAVVRPRRAAGQSQPVGHHRAPQGGQPQSLARSEEPRDGCRSTTSSGGDTASGVADKAQGVVDSTGQSVKGNPWPPVSSRSARACCCRTDPGKRGRGRASQKLVDIAKEHGQPVVDQAKAAGQELPAVSRAPRPTPSRRSGTPRSSRPSASRTRVRRPPHTSLRPVAPTISRTSDRCGPAYG